MPSAAVLQMEIERSLAARFPAALSPAPQALRETASTGVAAVDTLLHGGLPAGAVSELIGAESSGRTSLALAFVASRTAEGRVCAWVDAGDAFDPESAAGNGVNLSQLLWVRCQGTPSSPGSRDVPQAERRRVQGLPLARLDQALRATDLLLHAGGFAAIVLDLANTAQEHGNRIPAATWWRFRQAAGSTHCSLVVLGRAAYAPSSAAIVLECAARQARTSGGTILSSLEYSVTLKRDRSACISPRPFPARRPTASTWTAQPGWTQQTRRA